MSSGYTVSETCIYIAAFIATVALSIAVRYLKQYLDQDEARVRKARKLAAVVAAVCCVVSGLLALARPVVGDVAQWMESSLSPILFCLGCILCAFCFLSACLDRVFQEFGLPILISVWSMYALQFYSGSSCKIPFVIIAIAVCSAWLLMLYRKGYSENLNTVFNAYLWFCCLVPDVPVEFRLCAFASTIVFSFDVIVQKETVSEAKQLQN